MRPIALGAVLGMVLACADPNETTTPVAPAPPPPSPTAAELATIDVVLGSETGIIAEKASGSERAQVAAGDFRGLAIAPDGTRIAYVRNGNLYISNPDGADARLLAGNVHNKPTWSPDQSRLVFSRDEGLFVIDVVSGVERRLTQPQPKVDGNPAWSPDGKRIVFTRYTPEFNAGLFTLNPNDESQIQLPIVSPLFTGPDAGSPVWSPDGTKVGFVSNGTIYTIAINGTAVAKPVSFPNPPGSVSTLNDWSGDGKWLAFTISTSDHLETHIGDFNERSTRLTSGTEFIAVALRRLQTSLKLP